MRGKVNTTPLKSGCMQVRGCMMWTTERIKELIQFWHCIDGTVNPSVEAEFDKRAEHIELRSIPYYLSDNVEVYPRTHLLHNGNLLPEAVRL